MLVPERQPRENKLDFFLILRALQLTRGNNSLWEARQFLGKGGTLLGAGIYQDCTPKRGVSPGRPSLGFEWS